jgi:uncharacterized repeat protein (TIGR01451 family)
MPQRGTYAAVVLLLGAALAAGQTGEPPKVIAVAQPRGNPAADKLPPLEKPPVQPVAFQPDTPPPAAQPAPRGSALSVEAVGPATVAPDQPLAYEIVVRNVGSEVLARVRAEDVLPPGAKLRSSEPEAAVQSDHLAWELGNLDPGVERRIKVEIQPAGVGEVTLTPTATFTLARPCRTRIVRPPFAVTQTAPETSTRGGAVTFQIHVANNSDQTIQGVVLSDKLPPGLQSQHGDDILCDVPPLAPGESKTINLETRAVATGRQTNVVSAQAPGGWQAESQASVLVTETPLAVRLDAPKQTALGQDVDCRVEVSNPGPAPAANVRVTQALPDGVDVLSVGSNGTLDPARRQVVWALGTLPAGQTQTLTLKLQAKAAGDWMLKASAAADGAPEAAAFQTVHVEGAPALWLEIVRHDDAIDLGAESVYEVRVLNQGPVAVPGVRLTASVSDGLLVTKSEGPTAAQVQAKQIVFEPLPKLPGRSDATYRLRVKGQEPGDWGLLVQVTADQMSKPLVRQVSAKVVAK